MQAGLLLEDFPSSQSCPFLPIQFFDMSPNIYSKDNIGNTDPLI